MKSLDWMNASGLYLEIGDSTLQALQDERGVELPLERQANGRLTEACKTRLVQELRNFLERKTWQPRLRAFCAIGSRGVSLRRVLLPAAAGEELHRLLRLQIESEFPLPPEALAWGYSRLGETRQDGAAKQELLVVAVKKEVVEQYAEILSRCGVNAVFTVAALARRAVCPPVNGPCAILEIGRDQSELALFEKGVPTAVRVLPWGEQQWSASDDAVGSLAKTINGHLAGTKLFVTGTAAGLGEIPMRLTRQFGGGVYCEAVNLASGAGRSAAVLGLRKSVEDGGGSLLLLQPRPLDGKAGLSRPDLIKLGAVALALVVAMLLLPYAQAVLLKPFLARKFAATKADAARLVIIDRELDFLRFLKQNQPPYLDALYLFAKCAPSGARVESLNMNRRGEVSLRGSMRTADQVSEFRAKLIASGFFSSVSVEEQAPTPDRQKVNVRISAQWKSAAQLQSLSFGPTPQEIELARTNKPASAGGPPPGAAPKPVPARKEGKE